MKDKLFKRCVTHQKHHKRASRRLTAKDADGNYVLGIGTKRRANAAIKEEKIWREFEALLTKYKQHELQN